MLTFLLLLAQDPVRVDRDALRELLAPKNRKVEEFRFDLDYLATLPEVMVASHSHPMRRNGKLGLFFEVQKDPLSFPERMQAIAARCLLGLPELFAAGDEIAGREPAKLEARKAEPVPGYPERVGLAIRKILEAIASKDPATIARMVLEVRGDLRHTGRYESEALVIDFDGDDVHKFDGPAKDVRVFIDVAGNDRYEGAVAYALGGIAMVFDFDGDDLYTSDADFGQAAAVKGTALLYEGGGNDRYLLKAQGQAFAREGVAALVDVAGNDWYEITWGGQGYGQWGGFAILLDRDGDDTYVGRDPMNGHPVTVPAPQDEKHNANMVQGAGQGYNAKPHRAGGVGILLDVRGDDTYRSGCWSQGVGYFMGLGALLDLEGDDLYESWVYVMGSGAHGGFGLQVDARGDDEYKVGGWNGLGMSVDLGAGIFLDGAGHDRYEGSTNCFASSIGLGVSVFQDSGGDDDYGGKIPKLGFGRFYEREDYNDDKQVTAHEKAHWAAFLDLSGMDRYPKGYGNVSRWDSAEHSGGLDRASPSSPLVEKAGLEDWENQDRAWVWEQLKKAASTPDELKALAEFGFAHGFVKDAGEALHRAGGSVPGCTYDPTLRLWLPPKDAAWVVRLRDYRAAMAKATVDDLHTAKPLDGPRWVRRECREIVAEAVGARRKDLVARVKLWAAGLKPLVDRRAALDEARAKDEKKLRSLWAARKQGAVKVDPAAREAARDLDKLDPKWRADVPLSWNLVEESLTLENFVLNEDERKALEKNREIDKGNESSKEPSRSFARELNAYRAMHGRGALALDAGLAKAAEEGLKAPKSKLADRLKAAGFEGSGAETSAKAANAVAAVEGAEDKVLLDARWNSVGLAVGANGVWWTVVAKRIMK